MPSPGGNHEPDERRNKAIAPYQLIEMMAVRLRARCCFDCSRRIRLQRQRGLIVKNNEMRECRAQSLYCAIDPSMNIMQGAIRWIRGRTGLLVRGAPISNHAGRGKQGRAYIQAQFVSFNFTNALICTVGSSARWIISARMAADQPQGPPAPPQRVPDETLPDGGLSEHPIHDDDLEDRDSADYERDLDEVSQTDEVEALDVTLRKQG
jgi:hypothetical protein